MTAPLVRVVRDERVCGSTHATCQAAAAFFYAADQLRPFLRAEFPKEATSEGPKVSWRQPALLRLTRRVGQSGGKHLASSLAGTGGAS
jgi:hypothetical protein